MAYVEQFHNLSSWREDNLAIDPHEVGVLDLLDTSPNMFVVVNPNKTLLKCAISTIPTPDNYEFKVEYNCSEVFGRPTATRKLYILNDSEVKASIKIFSVNKEFDPTVLKNMNVNLKDYELQTDTMIRGFAEGVSLPSGTNHIGAVSLTYDHFKAINDIKSSVSVILNSVNNWRNANLVSIRRENITDNYNAGVYFRIRINHLTNDGENDIKLTLTKNNKPIEVIVKSGETLNHYSIDSSEQNCSIAIEPLNDGETISYRILFDYC